MSVTILTKEDLQEFKTDILNEIKHLFQTGESVQRKKWLKSNEVRKLLNISSGTLQNLRINGTLTYTKIGGIMYYDNSDIEKVLNSNKVNALPTLFK
ncbi:MAG: helix-turn-helix domain-containing protein [Flavobacterium sp.]|uniref:helix-turn-helix domain-containing protein n=1 Tax=Flavobacterium sp. TaxID=239 RepID=UPI0032634405